MKGSVYATFKNIHRERRRLEDLVDRHGLQSDLVLKKSRVLDRLVAKLYDTEQTTARIARHIIIAFSKDPDTLIKTTPRGVRALLMCTGDNLRLNGNSYELQKKNLGDGRYRLSLKFSKPVDEKCAGTLTCGHCDNTCPLY